MAGQSRSRVSRATSSLLGASAEGALSGSSEVRIARSRAPTTARSGESRWFPYLQSLTGHQVARRLDEVEVLVRSRFLAIRWAAARALRLGRVGAGILRKRLSEESVPYVLAEICDSLGLVGDRTSLPKLRKLAAAHASAMVRCYALMAIVDIGGNGASVFLRKRQAEEKELRTRATIQCLLNWLGREESVESVVQAFSSKRTATRQAIANLCAQYPLRSNRRVVVAALNSLASGMPPSGARSDIRRTIALVRGTGPKGAARGTRRRE